MCGGLLIWNSPTSIDTRKNCLPRLRQECYNLNKIKSLFTVWRVISLHVATVHQPCFLPVPNCLVPPFNSEASCKTFHMKMSFTMSYRKHGFEFSSNVVSVKQRWNMSTIQYKYHLTVSFPVLCLWFLHHLLQMSLLLPDSSVSSICSLLPPAILKKKHSFPVLRS